MTDATACTGIHYGFRCPKRETCWRFLMPRSERVKVMEAPLYQLPSGGEWKCEEYWKVEQK